MNELKDTEKETKLKDVTTCTVEDLEEAVTEENSTVDKQELPKDTSVTDSNAAKNEIILSEPPAPEVPVDEDENPTPILDPTKVNLEDLSTEEIMNLYKLSIDVKNDPKLNPIPRLPESIKKYILDDGKAMGFSSNQIVFLAREMVLAFGSEISMDKEIKDIQDEIARAMNIPEFMDFYGEALRDTYEKKQNTRYWRAG